MKRRMPFFQTRDDHVMNIYNRLRIGDIYHHKTRSIAMYSSGNANTENILSHNFSQWPSRRCDVSAVSIGAQRGGEVPGEFAASGNGHSSPHFSQTRKIRSQTVAVADLDVKFPTEKRITSVREEQNEGDEDRSESLTTEVGGGSNMMRKHSLFSLFHTTTLRIGIVFLGRQSPGCHNIVWGLKSYVDAQPGGQLIGIALGALGFVKGYTVNLDSDQLLSLYRNQSGLDLLGRTDLTLRTTEDLIACARTCQKLSLDGVVVVGGVGTHADSALLAETMAKMQVSTKVIGVPASVENDIPLVEQTLGYDTACKVFSNIIGNIATLAASGTREWYFIRICGRSMSHIAAECALHAHPNLVG
ncbi:Pyrophosphate--fructose 6-phosphate 1-phosphotransferase subunit beta, putative [Perkinsus marinus ATCC 50983]|uniref:Pyrophosphate--fructose 6-phosphate 1-phosphotransferase subunit beta, putative n=1 Tax=Perkinsus marinus (strain ATCC 50983 / TXsc) TaxID=423536 RepID=C5KUJ2_PERM5|nr:Pyrophosphate--fructose 6-phosphate 1-phosphotransferase subunit beta, putative [Perkinsus marinus ATCC 50983]EER11879.1 Pyrophosphate--fructose 6-phosphate 1-phosphotransferase subunit beta, putative [Perkinsus marinus ATCC 50983]|eukprot:XP_002780084.1 Pyrophosphate--fructose 6-phosphate 1-phosphotransferase subunit beta, putative [Perkinsus marinus ATCC 50983]